MDSGVRVDFINNIKYTDLKGIVDDKNIETEHKIIAKINDLGKYEFNDERIILNGGYRFDNKKLVLEPNLELSLEKFSVKTGFDVYKLLYRLTDKINLPEFLLREEIESDKTNILGGNIKLGLEYKITNKFKLMAGAYGMYDKKADGFDIKTQYRDKSKFYTDLTLKYGYSNILRDVNINDENPVLISKKNMKKNSLMYHI